LVQVVHQRQDRPIQLEVQEQILSLDQLLVQEEVEVELSIKLVPQAVLVVVADQVAVDQV
jgi:hypothetical protein